MKPIISVLLLCAALSVPLSSVAACVLPVPDGDEVPPSPANLFGEIERVQLPYVVIRNGRTGARQTVSLKGAAAVYTVYGGDGPVSGLKRGLQVWVWYRHCARPARGIPHAAYFQVFSLDPGDRATLDREGRIIAVPSLPSTPQ
ncbi:hypothetical protein [Leeia sp.]|uniref:hypothetical protein n=1 Tax=Leeia sp. TaxID=2884678 RepID=UPI0035AFFC9B